VCKARLRRASVQESQTSDAAAPSPRGGGFRQRGRRRSFLPPSLSLRGDQLDVAHELLPSSSHSTGCATHLAHVNVCRLSLSPALPSLLLPSAALPSLASAPSLHTCICPSVTVSVSGSTQLLAGVVAGQRGANHRNARWLRSMQRVQRRARTCTLRAARTCALSPAARFGIDGVVALVAHGRAVPTPRPSRNPAAF